MSQGQPTSEFPQVARLLNIMSRLRDPERGCPWDQAQSFSTIVPYSIEEVYELAEAIDKGDMAEIQDELGDVLFQVVFYAQLGKEQGAFDFELVAKTIADKLERRHPHVFAGKSFENAEALAANWQQQKEQERQAKGNGPATSILSDIPSGLAPLVKAHKIQTRCAKVGFDWPSVEPVFDKIHEEIQEVQDELQKSELDQEKVAEEVGDLLFAVVNLARHLNVDSDTALRKANQKFSARFEQVEQGIAEQGKTMQQSPLAELEALWQAAKQTR